MPALTARPKQETKHPESALTQRQPRWHPFNPTWSHTAILVVSAALLIALVCAIAYQPHSELFQYANPYFVCMASNVWKQLPCDGRQFLLGYKVFLAVLLLLPFCARVFKSNFDKPDLRSLLNPINTGLLSLLFAFFSLSAFAAERAENSDWQPGVFVICALALMCWPALRKHSVLIACLILGALCIPGLFFNPDFSKSGLLDTIQQQQHYNVFLCGADKIAMGIKQTSHSPITYGFWIPLIVGGIEKCTHHIISYAGLIHLAQLGQALFLSTLLFLYATSAKKNSWTALFAFLLVAPWYHCQQVGVLFPNHSGWRYLLLVAGLIALGAMRKTLTSKKAFLLGLICGSAILYNIETGIVLSAGACFALYLQIEELSWKEKLRVFAILGCGSALALLSYLGAYLAVTHGFPRFFNPGRILHLLSTPEIITMKGYFAPISILIFIHCAYLVSKSVLYRSSLSHRQILKGAVAMMVLIWEIYYFNRPFFSNLMSCFALYGLILIDGLRSLALMLKGRRKFIPSGTLALVGLTIIIIPSMIVSWTTAYPSYKEMVLSALKGASSANTESRRISGCLLTQAQADFVQGKCRLLKERNRATNGNLYYVTVYSLLIPKETGIEQKFPFIDPYFAVSSIKDYQLYIKDLLAGQPKEILIDDPRADPAFRNVPWHVSTTDGIGHDISRRYSVVGQSHGWTVYRRK